MALLYLQSYAILSYSLGFYCALAAIDSAVRSVGRISCWHRFAHFCLLSLTLARFAEPFTWIQLYWSTLSCLCAMHSSFGWPDYAWEGTLKGSCLQATCHFFADWMIGHYLFLSTRRFCAISGFLDYMFVLTISCQIHNAGLWMNLTAVAKICCTEARRRDAPEL